MPDMPRVLRETQGVGGSEEVKRIWYIEKWKEKHNRWELWDESTSLLQTLWTCIYLRAHGHKSRIGRYGRT